MQTWYDYRAAWSRRPWIVLIAVVAALMLIAGIVGTIMGSPIAVAFIPGLAAIYIHHLVAQKSLDT